MKLIKIVCLRKLSYSYFLNNYCCIFKGISEKRRKKITCYEMNELCDEKFKKNVKWKKKY